MRDVGDRVGGGRVFAHDKIAVLGRACRKVELGQSRLGVLAFGGHVSRLAACRLIAVSATTQKQLEAIGPYAKGAHRRRRERSRFHRHATPESGDKRLGHQHCVASGIP
jgi:hypothetical protein